MASWVFTSPTSDFPIENLPYGVFERKFEDRCVLKRKTKDGEKVKARFDESSPKSIGVRIGHFVLDLRRMSRLGFFSGKLLKGSKCFEQESLNEFMSLTPEHWSEARSVITKVLSKDNQSIQGKKKLRKHLLVPIASVQMHLPANIGNYTDFYASLDHAKNLGTMMRGPDNALMPNWKHIPIGYHGRASSVVVSGTPVVRPWGQTQTDPNPQPEYTTCKQMDFELEVGVFVGGKENPLGTPITIEQAQRRLFGVVLLNDWSARDVQKWEYVPLGPFCAKNFCTTISPWVVTMEALKPFLCDPVYPHDPKPLPYLQDETRGNFDVHLQVNLKSAKAASYDTISNSNMKYLYWTFKQQLVHHSSTGCNMRPGDLLGSGTISGPKPEEYGSMIELAWRGTKPVKLSTGEERKFLADGDSILMTGYAQGNGFRVGFGECEGLIVEARKQ